MLEIGVIGGDEREEFLIKILAKKGFQVKVLKKPPNPQDLNICYFAEIEPVVKNIDVVIAPMSSTDQEGYLKASFIDARIKLNENFFNLLKPTTLFIIGMARPFLKQLMDLRGISYIELACIDEIAILNAIPTAEGALKIAIEETPFTLLGSKTLVLGLGRVGLTLAWRLKLLGSDCYAVTRDKAAIARGRDLGIKMITYQELKDYLSKMDILFNTVPARIITREYISLLKKDSVIIDLASSPGGTDFTAAKEMKIKALLALGLPGKIAPKTAGEILGQLIPGLIKEHLG